MSTTTSRASAQRKNSDTESGQSNFLMEMGRHQLALVAEGARALCCRSEALRKIQQEAAHDASVFHAETGERLFSLRDPGELMSIQSELMRFALSSASNYWRQIIANAMNTPVDMMACIGQVLQSEKEHGVKTPLEAFQSVIPPLANSFHVLHSEEDESKRLHS
jgi:Phasin protein